MFILLKLRFEQINFFENFCEKLSKNMRSKKLETVLEFLTQVFMEGLIGTQRGLTYGVKIRLPHAFVMALLFKRRNSTPLEMAQWIARLTVEHALSLASFVSFYRASKQAIKLLAPHNFNDLAIQVTSLVIGGIGGVWVFGDDSSTINQQIVLYLTSRVISGLIKRQVGNHHTSMTFKVNAALSWALVMWLWEQDCNKTLPDMDKALPRSLGSSMDYLYGD